VVNPFSVGDVVCDVNEMDFEVQALNKAAQTFDSNDRLQIRGRRRLLYIYTGNTSIGNASL